jgi:glycosyltransferase involved in cell wall biosynthesis
MFDQPLVSIIIPTYNRAHLIGETLDSVVAQTYQNWECIVVDDGSSDNTDELIEEYTKKDSRFKYYHRPKEHLPGGNGARNYGFKMSRGEYVNWFDSDDLMVAEKLELKVKAILENEVDFVVSKTKYFNSTKDLEKYYNFQNFEINFENFLLQKINLLTPDIFVSKNKIVRIKYNELIKSGQEYNFILKFLMNSRNYYVVDKVLTLRREHENSIQKKYRKNSNRKFSIFMSHFLSFDEIYDKLSLRRKKMFFYRVLTLSLRDKDIFFKNYFKLQKKSTKIYGYQGIVFFFLLGFSFYVFNKSHYFKAKFK